MRLSAPQRATISDCAALATLHHAAYTAARYRLYVQLWEGCAEEEIWRLHVELLESVVAAGGGERGVVVVVREVGDGGGEGDGEVVSYALWKRPVRNGDGAGDGAVVEQKERSSREWKYVRRGAPTTFPKGYNAALMKRKEEEALRRKASLPGGGDGMWHLSWLGTKTDSQGQGAAQKVIKWGLDQADEEGKMCHVSTDLDGPAYRLYEKMGFKVTGPTTELDFGDFGGEGRLRYVTMVREPVREKAQTVYRGLVWG